MPIYVRPKAISAAVAVFFALSIVGMWTNQSTFTCCKRALIGATIAYIAAGLAVKAINSILTGAMIASRINRDLNKARSRQKGVTSEIKD